MVITVPNVSQDPRSLLFLDISVRLLSSRLPNVTQKQKEPLKNEAANC